MVMVKSVIESSRVATSYIMIILLIVSHYIIIYVSHKYILWLFYKLPVSLEGGTWITCDTTEKVGNYCSSVVGHIEVLLILCFYVTPEDCFSAFLYNYSVQQFNATKINIPVH